MGNCWASHKLIQMQSESTIQEEDWFLGNDNFESSLYMRSIVTEVHYSFERVLNHVWKSEILLDCGEETKSLFNKDALEHLRRYIHIGVPNKLVRVVILKIFVYDDEMAKRTYSGIIDSIDEMPDLMGMPPTMEPSFGRKTLSNCFLTLKGNITCRRLLYIVKVTVKEIGICPVLPRIVQLLLWHFREYEVYQILLVLMQENTNRTGFSCYFPKSVLCYKEMAKTVLGHIDECYVSKVLKSIVKDMVSNLLIEYISPTMYSVILCYFISDGMNGILKLIIALLGQVLPLITQVNQEDYLGMVNNLKKKMHNTVHFPNLLKKAHKIRIQEIDNSSSIGKYIYNFLPVFSTASLILTKQKMLEDLAKVIPTRFLECRFNGVFSLFDAGFNPLGFVEKIKLIEGPFLILFENKIEVFGVFIDRAIQSCKELSKSESRIFKIHPDVEFLPHVDGKTIKAKASKNKGFCLSEELPIVEICPSFSTTMVYSSHAFGVFSVAKTDDSEVFNLEVFELIE